jgi:hypothetical protein
MQTTVVHQKARLMSISIYKIQGQFDGWRTCVPQNGRRARV